MSQPPKTEAKLKDETPPNDEKDSGTDEDGEGEREESRKSEKETCSEDLVTETDEIYKSSVVNKIKERLLIVNENDKKLTEGDEEVKNKCGNGNEEEDSVPPALPPRPPPRPRQTCTCTCALDEEDVQERDERRIPRSCWASGLRKYVFLCTACGSLSILLGALFLTVYFMLKSYTSSLNHFETIPTYVPSGMLIATGFLIICLACRKNRNTFLMKLCGLCSLCCAVICVSVTVTTTVIHMNRLQTLRECLYTIKTKSCTCYSVLMDNDRVSEEGIKFVFNSTPDCEVIHGALYSCLRAIFGLSVIGILVCIFSCMLVYQLLSHEKKKMYWAQLEMRCRYLYRQRNPHYYGCCDECRYPPHPHELFPWDFMGNRFWSSGRIGNLYTPNPEDRGNNRLRSGWNWRRLPWSRSGGNTNEPTRANLSSPDSQYGFSSTPAADGAPYTVLDPRTPAVIPGCHAALGGTADVTEGSFYSWGPPPPYASNRNSANNSPARRSLGDILHQVSPIRRNDNVSPARAVHHVHRHHMHHNRSCEPNSRQGTNIAQLESFQKTAPLRTTSITNSVHPQQPGRDPLWGNSLSSVQRIQKFIQNKGNYENIVESENVLPNTGFNTLPSLKKRNQPKASDIFQDQTSTAYFFASAENLGCSTSNVELENNNETLPPRVYLTSGQPNSSRCSPGTVTKSQNDLISKTSKQGESQEVDRNTSLVRKLFVNCSPTKQKPRTVEPQIYSVERGRGLAQTPKKKPNKKIVPKEFGDGNSETTISFHYRVGMSRSPNIQNFTQYTDKSSTSYQTGEGSESWSSDKTSEPEGKNQKMPKGAKYMSKDLDLLQKHNSLIMEFSQNMDVMKQREAEARKPGIENEAFYQSDEIKHHFPKSFRQSPNYVHKSRSTGSEQTNEDFKAENESDVYFGDVSNSSCYMSLQNDGQSLLYEDSERNVLRYPTGHPVLNKQNLKMIEGETLVYNDVLAEYESQSDNTQPVTYCRHQNLELEPKHRYRHRHEEKSEEYKPDVQRRCNEGKFYTRGLKTHYHHQENSNDEQSSGSQTADSGISSGRSVIPNCFENTYHEIERPRSREGQIDERMSKISSLDFSHPLFQKPKVFPRESRYKDLDRQKKTDETEQFEKRRNFKAKPEEMSNQLLSTCNLTLNDSDHFVEDEYEMAKDEEQKDFEESMRKSPKPLPRMSVLNKNSGECEQFGKRYAQNKERVKHFLAPDAQYEYQEEGVKTPKLQRSKPAVPARPLNLQPEHKKAVKGGMNLQKIRSVNESASPMARRKQTMEESQGHEDIEMGTHSVNV